MRRVILFFALTFATFSFSQNKQVLFNFAEIPQTLLLNPGTEINYKYHIGIPFLSGISSSIGSTNFVAADLFLADNIAINTKIEAILNNLDESDNITFNTQIDVLNAGFRFNKKTYFSFGFYEELDAIAYFPNDIATLIYEGNNAYLNRSFSFAELLFKIDILGVLHIGMTKKMNKKLTLGGRFKIYSSSLNIETKNNSGTLTTNLGEASIYSHYLNNINMAIYTSGLVTNDTVLEDERTLYKDTFLGGNLGFGIDFGLTYHFSSQLEFTGSVTDLGFINHTKNNKTHRLNGDYMFEGINLQYDPDNPRDYWQELNDDFKSKVSISEDENSYITWRPTKINAAIAYSYGRIRTSKECYAITYKEYYHNTIGLHLYSVFRPLKPQYALTGFYKKTIGEKFHAKITYTIDDFSTSNLGVGISTQIGFVNLYGMADNIFKFSDLATANSISFQLGLNLIFN